MQHSTRTNRVSPGKSMPYDGVTDNQEAHKSPIPGLGANRQTSGKALALCSPTDFAAGRSRYTTVPKSTYLGSTATALKTLVDKDSSSASGKSSIPRTWLYASCRLLSLTT